MTNESTSEGTVRVDATVRAMTGPEIRRAMRDLMWERTRERLTHKLTGATCAQI